MAIFGKGKSQEEQPSQGSGIASNSVLHGLDYKTLWAVCDRYANPASLGRSISLYRPLFRMEEGSLFHGATQMGVKNDDVGDLIDMPEGMPAFLDLVNEVDREAVGSLFSALTLSVGSTVYLEGDLAEDFFYISKGRLAVFTHEPGSAEELELDTLTPGEFFGEEALLGQINRPSTIRVVDDALIMKADAASLGPYLANSPQLKDSLEKVREKRVSEAIARVLRRNI